MDASFAVAASASFLAGAAVRIPGFRIHIENNGGVFLLRARQRLGDRGLSANASAPLTEILFGVLLRILGDRWDYRWVRGIGAAANGLATAAVLAVAWTTLGPAAGIAAAAMILVGSAVPQIVGWFTCPEWYALPFMTAAFGSIWAGIGTEGTVSIAWLLAAGTCAAVAVGFKFTAMVELAALTLWAAGLAYAAGGGIAGAAAAVGLFLAVPFASGLLLVTACGGPWRFLAGPLRNMIRYKQAEIASNSGSIAGAIRKIGSNAWEILTGWGFLLGGLGAAAIAGAGDLSWTSGLLLWGTGGIAALLLQGRGSPGHWVQILPPLSILAGGGLAAAIPADLPATLRIPALLLPIAGAAVTLRKWIRYRGASEDHRIWQESFLRIGRHASRFAPPSEPVFVWGWHPQTYLFLDRRPLLPHLLYCRTSYLDLFVPDWRTQLLEAFERDPPSVVVRIGDECPMAMLQVLTGRAYRTKSNIRTGRDGPQGKREGPLGSIDVRRDAPLPVSIPAPDRPWQERIEALRERFEPLWRERRYDELSLILQAAIEWDPNHAETRRWIARCCPNYGVPPRSSLPRSEAVLHLFRAADGDLGCWIDRNGMEIPLTDSQAPRLEGSLWAERFPDDAPRYLIVGLGIGHGLSALLERIGPEARVTVVEREIPLYREAWQRWGDLFERHSDHLTFHVERPIDDLKEALERWDPSGTVVAIWERAAAVDPDYYRDLAGLLETRLPAVTPA